MGTWWEEGARTGGLWSEWAHIHTKTCTQMLKAALFLIAPKGNQPQRPCTGEVSKLCYSCAVEWSTAQQ